MANNVVEHLTTVDILEDHVIVVLVNDHFPHAADVRVVKKHGKGSFPKSTNFLGGILGGLFRCRLRTGCSCSRTAADGDAGKNFDSKLCTQC